MNRGLLVTERTPVIKSNGSEYLLLKGDIIVAEDDLSFTKIAPGLCIGGLKITPETLASLQNIEYRFYGLDYTVKEISSGS